MWDDACCWEESGLATVMGLRFDGVELVTDRVVSTVLLAGRLGTRCFQVGA